MLDFRKLWKFLLQQYLQMKQWCLGDASNEHESSHASSIAAQDPDQSAVAATMNKPAIMDAETRSYHEHFMREAIAMVRPTRWRS
jgi:hypothetical protein